MNSIFKNVRSCLIFQRRYKFRGNKPRPCILERRVMEEITKPFYEEQIVDDLSSKCSIMKYRKQEMLLNNGVQIKNNMYEQFLINEALKVLSSSFLVAMCQLDSINVRRLIMMKNMLLDDGLHLVAFPENVVKKAMIETKYKNLCNLMSSHTVLVVSCDDKVSYLIKSMKKIPDLHLLGGVVGDNMLTRQGMMNYSTMPSADLLMGHMITHINTPATQFHRLLSNHQIRLSQLLNSLQIK